LYNNKPFKLLYNKLFVLNEDKIKKINPLLGKELLKNRFEVNKMKETPVLLYKNINKNKDIAVEDKNINKKEKPVLLNEFNKNIINFNDCKFNSLEQKNKNLNNLETILYEVSKCQLCELSNNRKNVVFQRGSSTGSWFVVGDSPSEQDENSLEPFCGDRGLLLNKMLQAIGIDFNNDAYITNIVKCKTDINLNPTFKQIDACKNYLVQQIRLVKPKIILSLGKDIIDVLLYNKLPINKVRGNVFYFENIPIIVTFSPSYLLRNNEAKKLAWQDLQFALKIRNNIC
jgi:uracil-DNA glycosylase family 4